MELKDLLPQISLKFEPRDIWIGVYWNHKDGILINHLKVYICFLPFFPIRLYWKFGTARQRNFEKAMHEAVQELQWEQTEDEMFDEVAGLDNAR